MQSAIAVTANGEELPQADTLKKKAPLTSPEVPATKKETSVGIDNVSEQNKELTETVSVAQNGAAEVAKASNVQNEPAAPQLKTAESAKKEERKRKKRRASFALGNNLDAMEASLNQKIAESQQGKEEEEEEKVFEINPDITINKELFDQALLEFTEKLKNQHKMNLVSAIQNGRTELKHNQWRFFVENEVCVKILRQERDLLPFLREKTQVLTLFLDLQVDPNYTNPRDLIPYTQEEKLQELAKRNESIKKLQEIFKTRIIYR